MYRTNPSIDCKSDTNGRMRTPPGWAENRWRSLAEVLNCAATWPHTGRKGSAAVPELRKDPITRRWVIIATERAARPTDFPPGDSSPNHSASCPFCEGHEAKTPREITAIRRPGTPPDTPGWEVRVVPNKFPALRIEGSTAMSFDGLYESMGGVGAHEVII